MPRSSSQRSRPCCGRRAGQLTNARKWRTSTGRFARCAPERGQPREGTHDAIQGLSFRNSDAGSGVQMGSRRRGGAGALKENSVYFLRPSCGSTPRVHLKSGFQDRTRVKVSPSFWFTITLLPGQRAGSRLARFTTLRLNKL